MNIFKPAPKLSEVEQKLAEKDISLKITKKKVKNINFRVKAGILQVSCSHRVSNKKLAIAIEERLDWAIRSHDKLLIRAKALGTTERLVSGACVYIWGEPHRLVLEPCVGIKPSAFVETLEGSAIVRVLGSGLEQEAVVQKLLESLYRQVLIEAIPAMFAKWEPIVGKTAKQTRLKKMHTRWGSCNTKEKRIWLSIFLAKFPKICCEYVIVHELCHLHEANHSPRFWAQVARTMPDYKYWHEQLKQGGLQEG